MWHHFNYSINVLLFVCVRRCRLPHNLQNNMLSVLAIQTHSIWLDYMRSNIFPHTHKFLVPRVFFSKPFLLLFFQLILQPNSTRQTIFAINVNKRWLQSLAILCQWILIISRCRSKFKHKRESNPKIEAIETIKKPNVKCKLWRIAWKLCWQFFSCWALEEKSK